MNEPFFCHGWWPRTNGRIERNNSFVLAIIEGTGKNHALVMVAKTGLYTDDLKVWKKREEDEKTWSEFQDFMLNAQTELRQQQATTKQIGYGMQAASMQVAVELFAAAGANNNNNATNIQEMLTMFLAKMENMKNQSMLNSR
jgi:hypothetical protein